MRHANQRTNYDVPTLPANERRIAGRYLIEKQVDGRWVLMSYGDEYDDAATGRQLDHLIRRAVALEGQVRIRRRKDDVVVWSSC